MLVTVIVVTAVVVTAVVGAGVATGGLLVSWLEPDGAIAVDGPPSVVVEVLDPGPLIDATDPVAAVPPVERVQAVVVVAASISTSSPSNGRIAFRTPNPRA